MAITSFGYDTTVGQQPGPGGWWPGTGGSRGGSSAGGQIDYSATTPGASGEIGQISDLINEINRGAQTQANQARIPLAPTLEAQSSRNIQGELQGQLPPDVMALIAQNAAAAGVASGSVGSPAGYLKALGLTSLGQTEAGQRDLSAAYARNPGAPIYDPSKQLITPYQAAELGLQAEGLATRGGGGGYGAPSTRGGSPGYGSYSPDTTTSTAPGPAMGSSIPFDWLASIGYGGSPLTSTSTGGGTMNIVPPGSELWPNEGVYVDPTTMQAYDYSSGAPVDYFSPGPAEPGMGTNLNPSPITPTDYSWDQIFAGLSGQ